MTSEKESKLQNCRTCLIIRYFLIAVFFIILLGLVFTDKTQYLSFVKADYVAYIVFIVGIIIFFSKLFQHLKKSSASNQSNKVRDIPRKSSKSVSSKKIN